MDLSLRNRSKAFIQKGLQELEATEKQIASDLNAVNATYQNYVDTVSDYITARQQYIDYLEKYQDSSPDAPVMSSMFPGVMSHLPSFSAEEMAVDSNTMKQLADIIQELSREIDALEDQLLSTNKRTTANIGKLVLLANKHSTYLDQLITGMDSAYDVGKLSAVD